jgi:GT2 family glycosyltransferase
VVVDTTPNDPELESAIASFPGVRLIRSTENVGFGCANNLGVEWALTHTECEFFFLLNNDTVICPDSIKNLELGMTAQLSVGIMVPRIAYLDAPTKLWYGGGEIDWRRASAFTPGFNKSTETKMALSERDVTFATGCALFVRRSVFESIGGFDPRFFMYEEDVEYCLRVRERGVRIRYIPKSFVLHRAQGSIKTADQDRMDFWSVQNPKLPFYAFHVIRNRMLNMYLHGRGKNLMTAILFFPLFVIRRAVPFLLGGRVDAVIAMFKGAADFWRIRRDVVTHELVPRMAWHGEIVRIDVRDPAARKESY